MKFINIKQLILRFLGGGKINFPTKFLKNIDLVAETEGGNNEITIGEDIYTQEELNGISNVIKFFNSKYHGERRTTINQNYYDLKDLILEDDFVYGPFSVQSYSISEKVYINNNEFLEAYDGLQTDSYLPIFFVKNTDIDIQTVIKETIKEIQVVKLDTPEKINEIDYLYKTTSLNETDFINISNPDVSKSVELFFNVHLMNIGYYYRYSGSINLPIFCRIRGKFYDEASGYYNDFIAYTANMKLDRYNPNGIVPYTNYDKQII